MSSDTSREPAYWRRLGRKGRRSTSRLLLEIDVGERLPIAVADDEAGVSFLDGPGRRLALTGWHYQGKARFPRRTVLPKDLPKAIRYLEDQELDWLLRAATEEAKRRGRPMPMTEASPTNTPAASSEPIPKQTKSPGRPTHQRQIRPAAASLSRGQVNAVRAAFKAGVTPIRIARQFGLSQSDVRKALSYDEPKQ